MNISNSTSSTNPVYEFKACVKFGFLIVDNNNNNNNNNNFQLANTIFSTIILILDSFFLSL